MPTRNTFFETDTVANGEWSHYDFGTPMQAIHIINRGTADIEFSFNGDEVDGKLLADDFSETRDNMDEKQIFVRGVGGSASIQIEAWRGER